MLCHLIYRSKISRQIRLSDAQAIASEAAEKNRARAISGLLLYTPTHFVQVIEGESSAIHELYERIKKDPRHEDVQIIADGPISERRFGDWGMRVVMPRLETSAEALGRLDEERALDLFARAH